MDNFKNFIVRYRGALIGIIVAIIILCTKLYMLVVGAVLVVICAFLGNYIQQNKYEVKEKIKSFIDRM